MHRDVKPHNVMIDHENRKVRSCHVAAALFRISVEIMLTFCSSYD
jgi:serine/threonine protein kinase